MPKIIVLVGPPGSGKSTLAYGYNFKSDAIYTRISQDDQGKQGHIDLFWKALEDRQNIVVDRMGFSIEQRNRYLHPAKEAGYETEIIVLHVPFSVCFKRCLDRKDHPTITDEKGARSALHTFFTKYDRVQDSDADTVTRLGWDGHKPPAIWVDVDNTLAETSHREHFLQGPKKNWRGFFLAMGEDTVNNWCKQLMRGMSHVAEVLVVSARPDDYRKITESWLLHNEVPYGELIMRARGDYRKDSIVKLQILEFEIKTRYNLLFSVDDRKQVVDEIRLHGVTVLDCAGEKGNF